MKTVITLFFFTICIQPLLSQCYMDRHSTNAHDGWISCETSSSPNPAKPDGHWILYDLGDIYPIHDVQLWNQNHPEMRNFGFKDFSIEYSQDSIHWVMIDTFTLPKATALSRYEGYSGIDLSGINCRYLLLTALNNYGGSCYSLGEIKIYTSDQVADDFTTVFQACENDGILKKLSGGFAGSGVYSGPGVTDNGDGSFDFDPDVTGPGEYEIEYTEYGQIKRGTVIVLPCFDLNCMDCPECDKYDQSDLDSSPIPENVYHGDTLQSSGTAMNPDDIDFRANKSIEFSAGFEVQPGAELIAWFRDCEINQIQNMGFEDSFDGWSTWSPSWARNILEHHVSSESFAGDSSYYFNLNSLDSVWSSVRNWHVQLRQRNKTLIAGQEYELSFATKSDAQREIKCRVRRDVPSYETWFEKELIIKPYWEHHSFRFTPTVTDIEAVRCEFFLSYEMGEYWIDHVRLVPVD